MSKSSGKAWWTRLRRSGAAVGEHVDTDFANMGTAFGLDASFAWIDDSPLKATEPQPRSSYLQDRLNGRSSV